MAAVATLHTATPACPLHIPCPCYRDSYSVWDFGHPSRGVPAQFPWLSASSDHSNPGHTAPSTCKHLRIKLTVAQRRAVLLHGHFTHNCAFAPFLFRHTHTPFTAPKRAMTLVDRYARGRSAMSPTTRFTGTNLAFTPLGVLTAPTESRRATSMAERHPVNLGAVLPHGHFAHDLPVVAADATSPFSTGLPPNLPLTSPD